jgi:hypothetical protein
MSSDSDFNSLATRIREAGLAVYGFGDRTKPAAFVAAYDKFVYLEILKPDLEAQQVVVQATSKKPTSSAEPEELALQICRN